MRAGLGREPERSGQELSYCQSVTADNGSDALKRLNLIYSDLHAHESRLSEAEPDFAEGSQIARDAHRSTVLQPGHRAYFHLRSAYEFLDSIGRLVQVNKTFNPLGVEQAMGRTALLAACKALYLLEPETTDERFRRCAGLVLEDNRSSLREVRDALAVLGDGDPMREFWTRWQGKLEEDRDGVRMEATRLQAQPQVLKGDGELFGLVGEHLDRIAPLPQPEGRTPSKTVSHQAILMRYWNQTSGYVHAHTWPLVRNAESKPGAAGVTITANVRDVVGLLGEVLIVFKAAIGLLEQRSE